MRVLCVGSHLLSGKLKRETFSEIKRHTLLHSMLHRHIISPPRKGHVLRSVQHSAKRNHTKPDLPPFTRHLNNVCVTQPLQPRKPNTAVQRNGSENCFLIPLNRSHTFYIPMTSLNDHTNTHTRVDVSTDLHSFYSTALRTSSSSSSSSSSSPSSSSSTLSS